VESLTARVKRAAEEAGFDGVGVCSAVVDDWMMHLEQWLDLGCHGAMGYMGRQRALRLNPQEFLPGAKSVVMVMKAYSEGSEGASGRAPGVKVARYARGRDYHDVVGERLAGIVALLEGEGFGVRPFVDSSPVMEKAWAWRCGLGSIGRNQLLVSRRFGSYVVLGGLMTSADLGADEPGPKPYSICGDCRRCVRHCPTQALNERYVDATLCLSYWTVEQKADRLPSTIGAELGGRIFGCDACQEVCPMNLHREVTDTSMFEPMVAEEWLSPSRLKEMDDEAFREFLGHTAMARGGLDRLQRNLLAHEAAEAERTEKMLRRPRGGRLERPE